MAIEDKLTATRFNLDTEPHISVDTGICVSCPEQACRYVCPVQNFALEDGRLVFAWQGCLECGACRIVCSRGAIDWQYPRGGFGVCFRYG